MPVMIPRHVLCGPSRGCPRHVVPPSIGALNFFKTGSAAANTGAAFEMAAGSKNQIANKISCSIPSSIIDI